MKWFNMGEFCCPCCGDLPLDSMNTALMRGLDKLREQYGKPIYVSSGYRCPVHNCIIGGEPNSQHIKGNACDIYVDGDYQEFYNLVVKSNFFDGVGYYPVSEFIHVDCRDDGKNPNYYRWEGK